MRYNIKTLLAVGMAAAVLTACSGGGTETKDSGQTVSETDGAGGAAQFNAPDSQSEGSRQRGDQFGDEFDSIGLTHAS